MMYVGTRAVDKNKSTGTLHLNVRVRIMFLHRYAFHSVRALFRQELQAEYVLALNLLT